MLQSIGQGASGDVYLAHDRSLSRKVAVKVLHAALANDQIFLRRFQAEAKSAAALTHPAIMSVFDWGDSQGMPYLVLELLDGGSLRDHFARGRSFSLAQVVNLGLQSASGLAYAHQRNYIHRDLKPANLIFDDDGRIRIADFGLARALSEAAWTEPVGVLIGTARYASPEQAQGATAQRPSDIYSLGLVLYECLAGRSPFQGDTTISLLMARVGVDVQSPPQAGILAPVLERCLYHDPQRRLSASELVLELEKIARRLDPPAPIAPLRIGPYVGDAETSNAVAAEFTQHLGLAGDSASLGRGPYHNSSFIDIRNEVASMPQGGTADRVELFDDDLSATAFDGPQGAVATSLLVGSESALVKNQAPIAQPKGRPRRLRNFLIWLICTVVLAGLAFSGALLYDRLTRATVPSLVGMNLPQAQTAAHKGSLKILVTSHAYSAAIPSGEVISTFPRSGVVVSKHSVIDLTISKGHAPVQIPALSNLDQSQISAALSQVGLRATFQLSYSETVQSGLFISSTPAPTNVEPFGSTISVTLSKGPAPREVPNLVGDTQQQAAAALSAIQLGSSVTTAYSNTVAAGVVISQGTAASSYVPRGTSIALVVSLGKHYVNVPNLAGDTLAQAQAALSGVGLSANLIPVVPGSTSIAYYSPTAGAQVLYGSTVDLYLVP